MKSFIFPFFKNIYSLTRFPLSLSVGFSGFGGYVLVSGIINQQALFVFLGIFILASGASALNQIQEKKQDALMGRTSKRAIPAGILSVIDAFLIAIFLIVLGWGLLFFAGGIQSFLLGVFSILWYNALYTYLKRKTAFAVFPGSITGVVPIMIGWMAAGGKHTDSVVILISLFMALWQLPHFLILMLRFQKEYRNAGFPVLTDFMSVIQVKFIVVFGYVLMLTIIFLMIYFGQIIHAKIQTILAITGIAGLVIFIYDIKRTNSNYKIAFITINIFMLVVMGALIADKLIV